MTCHHNFHFDIDVAAFEDRKPLAQVEIRAACTKCPAVLEFLGMECGVDMNGPSVSPDNREARLAVAITTEPASIKHVGGRVKM